MMISLRFKQGMVRYGRRSMAKMVNEMLNYIVHLGTSEGKF